MPSITVFTATYNRARTLDRVFAGLRAQTFRDFEWLIIDDGSTDGTRETVAGYHAPFPIEYRRQEHRGKHVAHNRALDLARGELFVILDSDDELAPHALQRFHDHGSVLSPDFLGVACWCRDRAGRVIGNPPAHPVSAPALAYILRRRIDHDLAGCVRTDILRRYRFPEPPGVMLVPEGMVWNRMMRRHRMLFIDEVLETKHYERDGYTGDLARSYVRHADGRHLHFLTNLNENTDALLTYAPLRYAKDLVQLGRMTFNAKRSIAQTAAALRHPLNRAFFLAALPVGYLLHRRDTLR